MEELKTRAHTLKNEIESATSKLRISQRQKELNELRKEITKPDFWQNSAHAQAVTKQEAALNSSITPWLELQLQVNEIADLVSTGDLSLQKELEGQITDAESKLEGLKKDLKFQGLYDDHDVVLSIYAGAGGTDAQDWAQMLERMYLRYAESEGLKARIVDESAGEEAGIKSATLEITGGQFLFGKLAGEHGVHRLVRLSPFNADHKRQTSFAKVEILPLIDKPGELEIDEKDLKIDVFRAGGHGGQSVNTTDSAVRVTHLPTGISVAIQNERSQLQNKQTALSILSSKLVQLQLEQHAASLKELKGPDTKNEWGSQIRSYVLHPYKQVKDLRTSYTTSDPGKILNGDLNGLINSWLEKIS